MTADARRAALTDAEALGALRSGDALGVDGLYTNHGWAVHDFCRAVVRDDARAGELTVATFVTAVPALIDLEDPGRVRPLLLAVARREVLQGGRHAFDPEVIVAKAADEAEPERDVLAAWFWAWLGELEARDRALLDLHVRQRLHGDALADALRLDPRAAERLRERVMERATIVLRTQLVALTHATECPHLSELVVGWDRTASPLVPSPIADHIVLCERCGPHQLADPLTLVAAIEAAPLPDGLRDRVLDAVALPARPALPARSAGNGVHVAGATLAAIAASSGAGYAAEPDLVVAPIPTPIPVAAAHPPAAAVAVARPPSPPRPGDGDEGPPRLLVGVLVAVGLVALAFIGALLTRDSSGTGDSAAAAGAERSDTTAPTPLGETRVPATTAGVLPESVVVTTAPVSSTAPPSSAGQPSGEAPADAVAAPDAPAVADEPAADAPVTARPPTVRSTDPAPPETDETDESAPDTSPPVDEAPSVPDTTPDAPPATAAPTTAPAPGTTAPSPAPNPVPAPQSPSTPATNPAPVPGVPAVDTTPPRFRSVRVVPGTIREASGACSGSDRAIVLVDVSDDSGSLALTGRWTVRATRATGTFSFRDDPLLGWQGDLGGVPDTLSGGASSPFDIVLTAVDPSGNRWSVGTTVTLEDC